MMPGMRRGMTASTIGWRGWKWLEKGKPFMEAEIGEFQNIVDKWFERWLAMIG
jgi:hypothetical protein